VTPCAYNIRGGVTIILNVMTSEVVLDVKACSTATIASSAAASPFASIGIVVIVIKGCEGMLNRPLSHCWSELNIQGCEYYYSSQSRSANLPASGILDRT